MTRAIATVIATMVFVLSGGSVLAENLQEPGHEDPPEQCWQQTENGPVLGPCPQEEDEDEQVLHCAHYDENGKLVIGECPGGDDDPNGGDDGDDDPEEEPEDNSGTYNPTHHNPDVRVANPTFTG